MMLHLDVFSLSLTVLLSAIAPKCLQVCAASGTLVSSVCLYTTPVSSVARLDSSVLRRGSSRRLASLNGVSRGGLQLGKEC